MVGASSAMRQGAQVLVLCTGNSCRSQMAEAYIRQMAGDRLTVHSAGTRPAKEVHPLTYHVLGEDGIELGEKQPRDYREFLGRVPVHTLIIVCDGASKECPAVWPGAIERLNWPFADPAAFVGSDDETLARFRQVRDEIKETVRRWVGAEEQ